MATQTQITLLTGFAGENNNVVPRLCRLYCPNNTLAEVAAAGFLDYYLQTQSVNLVPTDFIFAVASDGHQIYKPVFTNGSCNLNVLP
jgi:hypothetical protein